MSPMGELKEEEERQKDVGFMRQVLRRGGACGGGFQYFPSDSASTTNQTQTRNTNTHTVGRRLNCAIPGLLKAFAPSTAPRPQLTHRRAKGAPWFTKPTVERRGGGGFVPQQGFLQPGMQITSIWHASTNSISLNGTPGG